MFGQQRENREAKREIRYGENGKPKHGNMREYDSAVNITPTFGQVIGLPFDIKECLDSGFCTTGTSQSGKTTLAKYLAQILRLSGVIVNVMDVSQAWTHDTPIPQIATISNLPCNVQWNEDESCVFDLSRLTTKDRFDFVIAFCNDLMRSRTQNYVSTMRKVIVIFEEAQMYMPNGAMRSLDKYGPVLDLISVGANFGVRFGLITQFPANVDKAPVKITQQRYFGWTTEKNDLNYIKSFLTEKEDIDALKKLNKGEFIYQLRGKTQRVKVEAFGQQKQGYGVQLSYAI